MRTSSNLYVHVFEAFVSWQNMFEERAENCAMCSSDITLLSLGSWLTNLYSPWAMWCWLRLVTGSCILFLNGSRPRRGGFMPFLKSLSLHLASSEVTLISSLQSMNPSFVYIVLEPDKETHTEQSYIKMWCVTLHFYNLSEIKSSYHSIHIY